MPVSESPHRGLFAFLSFNRPGAAHQCFQDCLLVEKLEFLLARCEGKDRGKIAAQYDHQYRRRVERLTEALNDPDGGRQAAEALRSLIGDIVLTPGGKRGEVHATLCGELFGILDFVRSEESRSPGETMPAAIARPRNQRFL
ncbi:hypothetical protein G6L79_17900 [Agrobacterium rhizogenes]|nr:hypothetical protein [Rhizobium rhizogenes]